MTNLIQSLAAAHRALADASSQRADNAALGATARRIESLMIAELAALSTEDQGRTAKAILASGSLKALKALPVEPYFTPRTWGNDVDTQFVLGASPTYRKEAEKRGFALTSRDSSAMMKNALGGKADLRAAKAVLSDTLPDTWEALRSLALFFSPPRCHDGFTIADPAASAPLMADVLKRLARQPKACEQLEGDLLVICVLPEPGMADEGVYARMTSYALLGLKKPPKTAFESAELRTFADTIFSKEGRKDLTEQTGGLEAWLAGGWRTPPAVVAAIEAKRRVWHIPSRRSRW